MHHAHGMRLRSRKSLSSHHVALRSLRPHGAQHIRADGAGQQTQARFRQTEGHVVGCNQHIAHRRQAHAAGVAVALHAAHDGHGALVQCPEHVGQLLGIGAVFIPAVARHGAHPIQIGACAKGFAMRAQYDGAQV